MFRAHPSWLLLLTLLLLPATASSSPILFGVLSFDSVDTSSNAIGISNLTGDPAAGGTALLPDFPVYTPVTFLSSTITVQEGSSIQVFFLGDLIPGAYTFPGLTFANTLPIAAVVLSATLSAHSLVLANGTSWTPATSDVNIQLTPATATSLVPGDSGLIFAESSLDVPEPRTTLVLCAALGILAGRWRRRC